MESLSQVEVTATVLKIVRAFGDRGAAFVHQKIKEYLPDVGEDAIVVAMQEIMKNAE